MARRVPAFTAVPGAHAARRTAGQGPPGPANTEDRPGPIHRRAAWEYRQAGVDRAEEAVHHRHRAAEFKKFLAKPDKEVPAGLQVRLILDKVAAHCRRISDSGHWARSPRSSSAADRVALKG